jgi:hypothetical protein
VLAIFHLERLRIDASDMETWHAVDALAREVRAIQRAVAALEEHKPWWVCTVHAAGEFSRAENIQRAPGGGRLGLLGAKDSDLLASYF